MRHLLLLLPMLFVSVACSTQKHTRAGAASKSSRSAAGTIPKYIFVEQMPIPRYNLSTYLEANLRYPLQAQKRSVHGRVRVSFDVCEDGSINNVKVVKGIGWGRDEEALRVIKNMPPWRPGKCNCKPVKIRYTQPISFKLR